MADGRPHTQIGNRDSDALVEGVGMSMAAWWRRARHRAARTFPVNVIAGLALYAAYCADTALRQWQKDRRTAYRFGYPTPREARRLRRAKRRAQNAATYRSWADGHEHPER